MVGNSRVPDVGHAQFFDFRQSGIREVIKFPYSILIFGTPRNVGRIRIPEKSSKDLINDDFF